jgi:hypothetical protein
MVMDEPSSVTKVYYVYFNGRHCPYFCNFPDFPVLAFCASSWNSFQIDFCKVNVDGQESHRLLDDFGRHRLLGCLFLVDVPDFSQTE